MSCAKSNVIGKSCVQHIMTEFLYRCPNTDQQGGRHGLNGRENRAAGTRTRIPEGIKG